MSVSASRLNSGHWSTRLLKYLRASTFRSNGSRCWVLRRLRAGRIPWLDARKPANCVIFKKSRWPMEERLCRKEDLSMVLSLYLCTTLGIIFFQSLDKFGGAFEEPFLPLEDRTRPMRRCRSASIIASTSAMALALRSRCDVWIIALSNCLQNFQCGIKADVATLEALNTAFSSKLR
jgi:hypothetical protein